MRQTHWPRFPSSGLDDTLDSLLALLDGVGTWAWRLGLGLLLVINGVAIVAVVVTRDRRLVDRWTDR